MYKYNYAITVKKNLNPYISDYYNYFKKLEDKYPKAKIVYMFEYGERNCLHAHGRISTNSKIYIDKIRPKGWGFDFALERHPNAWARYMTKNKQYQSKIIIREYEKERGLLDQHFKKEVQFRMVESLKKIQVDREPDYTYPHLDIRKLCS